MPPAKVREIVEKDLRVVPPQRLTLDHALYLKRYFGVSTLAMLRTLRALGYIGRLQLEEYAKLDPDDREREIFGNIIGGGADRTGVAGVVAGTIGKLGAAKLLGKNRKKAIPSDRYRLIQHEVARKITREKTVARAVQKSLPETD